MLAQASGVAIRRVNVRHVGVDGRVAGAAGVPVIRAVLGVGARRRGAVEAETLTCRSEDNEYLGYRCRR